MEKTNLHNKYKDLMKTFNKAEQRLHKNMSSFSVKIF